MDYDLILDDIKPTIEEKRKIDDVSHKLMGFLQNACDDMGIDAKVALVGSVAKTLHLRESLTLTYSLHFHWIQIRNF
jgi:tRNA nucleotidyltransferase (CCA-adding enzyme)